MNKFILILPAVLIISCGEKKDAVKPILPVETTEQSLDRIKQEVKEEAKPVFIAAQASLEEIMGKFKMAKNGVIKKDEALYEYNKSYGSALGKSTSFSFAEKRLIEAGEKYVEVLYLKEQARLMYQRSATEAAKSK